MVGRMSRVSNPLISDFVLMAQKLKKLGFVYDRGTVIVVDVLAQEEL